MLRLLNSCLAVIALAGLAACGANHSPDIYASNAVQQANKVDAGIIIGFREVMISANGTAGAVTGGAAGGVLGSQVGGSSFDQALGGVAGSALGSMLGNTIEHVTGDTKGWEYIVRKTDGGLISVTQVEKKPLELGQRVLVIAGAQARIVPDYSVDIPGEKPLIEVKDSQTGKMKRPIEEMPPPAGPSAAPAVERPTISELPPLAPRSDSATELPAAAPQLPVSMPK